MSLTPNRRHWLAWLAGLSLTGTALAQPANKSPELVFGMVPYLPVQQLLRLYEPMVVLFEQTLNRPCRLASAPNFDQFVERARRGEFDLVGASPHVARILHREESFAPMARATAPLEPVVIVPVNSQTKSLKDLAQRDVLVADPFAVHVLIALRAMRDQGLVPGRDVKLIVAGTQRNCVQRMLKGDAPAAVGSVSTLAILPPELTSQFRVLARAPKGLTPMAYVAHPRMRPQVDPLTHALMTFPSTAEGQALLKAAQHDGLTLLTPTELASVDPLVTEYYRQRAGT
jgi:phosphonate transport system substrate-binding protein